MERLKKEIGSEFWKLEMQGDVRYLLSGRTALELIVRDIVAEYGISTVYMPSYCCHTMIKPFVLHKFKVCFYDIFYNDGLTADIPESREDSVFFLIRYFGYEYLNGLDQGNIRKSFKIVIEDQTHSWLSALSSNADYTFASYKKWAGISGIAKAEKRNGKFISTERRNFSIFDEMREKAFVLKKRYIETGAGDKTEFLSLFNEAEELLENDYVDYVPSAESFERLMCLDMDGMVRARKQNAAYLIESLKSIPEVSLVNQELGQNDIPLCVPILVQDIRNELRRYLIANDIYLPVHWPMSDYHKGISERAKRLYDEELSLVCDQRYSEVDMERIIKMIHSYFGRN